MHIGSESRLLSLSSTIASAEGEDTSPMGGGSPDVSAEQPEGEAPADEGGEVPAPDGEPGADTVAPEGEQVAAPVEEEQPQVDPAVMAEFERIMAGQQAQAQPQMAEQFKQVLDPVIQQNQMLMGMLRQGVQQSQYNQQQAQVEASRPKPPDAGAPAMDHLKYLQDSLKWEQDQKFTSLESKFDQFLKVQDAERKQNQAAWQQQQAEIQSQRREQAYATGIKALSSNPTSPHMKVFSDPDAAAVLQAVHQRLPNMALPQVAQLLTKAFGLAPKTSTQNAAAARQQSQAALDARRKQAREGGRPMPAGAGNGKAGAPAKGAREAVLLAMKNGARFDRSLLDSLSINPNKLN
jgi:hypothetical protein